MMPTPSRSSIVQKGSAIQKSKNLRGSANDVRKTTTNALAQSQGMLEFPIEEAAEEEEMASKILYQRRSVL